VRWRIALLAAALLAVAATPASADSGPSSGGDAATGIIARVNQARSERGLVPLRSDGRLLALAGDRASRLASTGILSHEVAGSMPQDLAAQGVDWRGYGEVIGYAPGTPAKAALAIFRMWMASPTHWPLLMSDRYNYLGVGLVYRPGSGVTYASLVLTESSDCTGARAVVAGAVVSGDDIRWSWTGSDPALQTHTTGLRDFTLQLRTDRGTWVTIASGITATSRSTLNRERGHWYGLRVRARDRAGNTGPWSRELRVWLP
jgi:uncharacterized protein YkwD